jgi:hypothetical protein
LEEKRKKPFINKPYNQRRRNWVSYHLGAILEFHDRVQSVKALKAKKRTQKGFDKLHMHREKNPLVFQRAYRERESRIGSRDPSIFKLQQNMFFLFTCHNL